MGYNVFASRWQLGPGSSLAVGSAQIALGITAKAHWHMAHMPRHMHEFGCVAEPLAELPLCHLAEVQARQLAASLT